MERSGRWFTRTEHGQLLHIALRGRCFSFWRAPPALATALFDTAGRGTGVRAPARRCDWLRRPPAVLSTPRPAAAQGLRVVAGAASTMPWVGLGRREASSDDGRPATGLDSDPDAPLRLRAEMGGSLEGIRFLCFLLVVSRRRTSFFAPPPGRPQDARTFFFYWRVPRRSLAEAAGQWGSNGNVRTPPTHHVPQHEESRWTSAVPRTLGPV